MTIHQCVPNMSGDVTTRDLKPGPGTGDLALQSQALIQALITVTTRDLKPGPGTGDLAPHSPPSQALIQALITVKHPGPDR